MGWDFHNSLTMTEISNLGVAIDLSALPFQAYPGAFHDRGASFAGFFDWSTTSTAPYHPSRTDYRLPPKTSDDALAIVELPQGLLRSRLVGLLSEVRGSVRERSLTRLARAFAPRRGYAANTTIKACSPPPLFRAMIRDILRRQEDWIVTYFHPDELLPRKGRLLNDLIHKPEYFRQNVYSILKLAKTHGRGVEFLTAAEAADALLR
jgi:hypothetical protein